MDEQEEIYGYEQAYEPVWKDAVRKWYNNICEGIKSYGADCSPDLAREFAATVNWSPCTYCAGPCGNCVWNGATDPYACIPCPQEESGITECTHCPVATLKYLHDMLPKNVR